MSYFGNLVSELTKLPEKVIEGGNSAVKFVSQPRVQQALQSDMAKKKKQRDEVQAVIDSQIQDIKPTTLSTPGPNVIPADQETGAPLDVFGQVDQWLKNSYKSVKGQTIKGSFADNVVDTTINSGIDTITSVGRSYVNRKASNIFDELIYGPGGAPKNKFANSVADIKDAASLASIPFGAVEGAAKTKGPIGETARYGLDVLDKLSNDAFDFYSGNATPEEFIAQPGTAIKSAIGEKNANAFADLIVLGGQTALFSAPEMGVRGVKSVTRKVGKTLSNQEFMRGYQESIARSKNNMYGTTIPGAEVVSKYASAIKGGLDAMKASEAKRARTESLVNDIFNTLQSSAGDVGTPIFDMKARTPRPKPTQENVRGAQPTGKVTLDTTKTSEYQGPTQTSQVNSPTYVRPSNARTSVDSILKVPTDPIKKARVEGLVDQVLQSLGVEDSVTKTKRIVDNLFEPFMKETIEFNKTASKVNDRFNTSFKNITGQEFGAVEQRVREAQHFQSLVDAGEYTAMDPVEKAGIRKTGGISQEVLNVLDKNIASKAMDFGLVKPLRLFVQGGDLAAKAVFNERYTRARDAMTRLVKGVMLPEMNLSKEFKTSTLDPFMRRKQKESAALYELFDATKGLPKELYDEGLKFFKGEENTLPTHYKTPLQEVKNVLMEEGLKLVMNGQMSMRTYTQNFGTYLGRMYEAHSFSDYLPAQKKLINLKDTLRDDLKSRYTNESVEKIEARVEEAVASIIDKHIVPDEFGKGRAEPKTGGNFLKQRKLGEDKVSLAIRDFLGEIKDPITLAFNNLMQLKMSNMNFDLLKKLADSEYVTTERNININNIEQGKKTDYIKVNGEQWGPLDGKYVHKDLKSYYDAHVLNKGAELVENHRTLFDGLQSLNSFIKKNLTVYNPGGIIRNFTSNFATSQAILGHNFLSYEGLREVIQSFKELRTMDSGAIKELVAYGNLKDGSISRELHGRLDALEKQLDARSMTQSEITKALKDMFTKVEGGAEKVYALGDNVFLLANYKKLRAKGMKPIEALTEASRVTPNYGDVSPWVKTLRNSLIGVPFITWKYKVYPELVKQMLRTPLRSAVPFALPFIMGEAMIMAADMTDEEKKKARTGLYRDGDWTTPIRNASGNFESVNWSQYTPYNDAFQSKYIKQQGGWTNVPEAAQGFIKGLTPGLSSFPIQIGLSILSNYNPLTQKAIYDSQSGPLEVATDIAAYLSQPLLPFIGSATNAAINAAKNGKDVARSVAERVTTVNIKNDSLADFKKKEEYRDPMAAEKATTMTPSDKEAAKKLIQYQSFKDSIDILRLKGAPKEEITAKAKEAGAFVKTLTKEEKKQLGLMLKGQVQFDLETKRALDDLKHKKQKDVEQADSNVANAYNLLTRITEEKDSVKMEALKKEFVAKFKALAPAEQKKLQVLLKGQKAPSSEESQQNIQSLKSALQNKPSE